MFKKVVFVIALLVLAGTIYFYATRFSPNHWQANIPSINSLSSPRATDLNKDGVLDIVFGAGGKEWDKSDYGILALDGKSGELLWKAKAINQMAGSAIFQDITQDGIDDVFISGRSAQLYALDGASGKLLWEYLPFNKEINYQDDTTILNFFTPQWVPDQNKDGFSDLLISYGGFVKAGPKDLDRPGGKLMVFSGKDGALLAAASMPDGKETYFSPVVHDFEGNGNLSIIYGSGGETIDGALFKAQLTDLMQHDLSKSIKLASGEGKGFIAPALLTDITNDGIKDILVNAVNGRMLAYNGASNTLLWEVKVGEGIETYSTPVPVFFEGRSTPDVFASFGVGVWPNITQSLQFWVDGETGQVKKIDSLGTFQYSSPIVADVTGDGNDDVLFSVNLANHQQSAPSMDIPETYFTNKLILYDLHKAETRQFESFYFEGTNLAITPLLIDLDGDRHLDLVYGKLNDKYSFFSSRGISMQRFELSKAAATAPSWGSYMGSMYKGY